MDFKQLLSFVTTIRCGSFTKAAEKLQLSQPTVTGHIQALEEELDQRLIIRTTKSFEITPKGQIVFDHACHILDLKKRMLQDCRDDHKQIIHVGASTIPSAYILPRILPTFGKLHPDTYFVIHQSDSQGVIDGLCDGIFDIGLIGMKADDRLTCIPICSDRMILITPVTPKYLKLKALSNPPIRELLQEPIIMREMGSGSQKSAERFLTSLGIEEDTLHITARINDQETIKNMVAGGLGVSIISHRAAQNYLDEKRILSFALPSGNTRTMYLAYRKGYILPAKTREFTRYIKDQCKTL